MPNPLRHAALVLFLFAGMSFAPAQAPDPAASQPVNPAPLEPAPAQEALLQLPAGNIEAVLALYQELTGYEIIIDATVDPAVQLRLVTREPLPRDQAARFIESTLLLNGLALVETVDPGIYKLIVWTGDRPLRAEGIPMFGPGDAQLLPRGDEIVTYVMPLTHLDAEEAAQLMTQVVQLHLYGNIASSVASNTLVITENASVVRSLIDLQRYVDVPSAQTDTRWISLERADAERVSESIIALVEARGEARGVVTGAGGGGDGESNGAGGVAGNGTADLAIVPDTRTNRILLHGRPADISFYGTLIEDFDRADDSANFLRIPLRFVAVRDFLPVAAQALTRGNDLEVSTSAGEGDALSTLNQNNQNQANTGTGQVGGGENLLVSQARLKETSDVGIPDAVVVGRTLIVADNQANAVILTGPPEQVALIQEMATQLDIRPRQVMLSTVIGQLNLDESQTFGIDLVQLADQQITGGTDFTLAGQNVNGPAGNIVNPLDLGDLAGFPAIGGFNLYGRIGDNLNAYLHAIATNSNFNIVNRPTVFTRNNERAIISTGKRIAIPSQTISSLSGNSDNFSTSIQYLDVTLELEIIPLINSEDEVTLQIRQINDTISGSQTINGNEVPTVSTQGLVTTVTVPNGATLVLGGLIAEQTGVSGSGIPILREIPLIGGLFGSETETTERQELMIFIQPQIINTEADLTSINQEEIARNGASTAALQMSERPNWDELDPEHLEAVSQWRDDQAPAGYRSEDYPQQNYAPSEAEAQRRTREEQTVREWRRNW